MVRADRAPGGYKGQAANAPYGRLREALRTIPGIRNVF